MIIINTKASDYHKILVKHFGSTELAQKELQRNRNEYHGDCFYAERIKYSYASKNIGTVEKISLENI